VERRSDREVLDVILGPARADPRVRAVVLSGSRADLAAPRDDLQDFDVVFVVSEVASFRDDPHWISVFGEVAIVQFPEGMQGAAGRDDGGWAILMQFTDGTRIDLTLLPAEAMGRFGHDGPAVVLHDPDGLVPPPPPLDAPHHVPEPPSEKAFADVCNEFWWVAPYVAKGFVLGELAYARYHLDTVLRAQLMMVLDWRVAGGGWRWSVASRAGPGSAGASCGASWTQRRGSYSRRRTPTPARRAGGRHSRR
jgi:aminoglycoside 6-adenylyltransferase